MNELKPALKAIVEKIATHANNLTEVELRIQEGGVATSGGRRRISAEELTLCRIQDIGGLCSQLDTLRIVQMSPTELKEVLAELRKLTYGHATIFVAIEDLERRHQKTPPPA